MKEVFVLSNQVILSLDRLSITDAMTMISESKNEVGIYSVGARLATMSLIQGIPIFQLLEQAGAKRVFYHAMLCSPAESLIEACKQIPPYFPGNIFMLSISDRVSMETMRKIRNSTKRGEDQGVRYGTRLMSATLAGVSGELIDPLSTSRVVDAKNAGFDGVVAYTYEIPMIRKSCGNNYTIIASNISCGQSEKKSLTVTPAEAIRAGADYVLINHVEKLSTVSIAEQLRMIGRQIKNVQ